MNRVAVSRVLARRVAGRPRNFFFSRRYNGQAQQTSHTTYFQPPPEPPKQRRSILKTIGLPATWFILGGITFLYFLPRLEVVIGPGDDEMLLEPDGAAPSLDPMPILATQLATGSIAMTPMLAEEMLHMNSNAAVVKWDNCEPTVTHRSRLPSNFPCEDTWASVAWGDPNPWEFWMIFDGHAGPKMSSFLAVALPAVLSNMLNQAGCRGRPYTPNDPHITRTIQRVFTKLDKSNIDLLHEWSSGKEALQSEATALAAIAEQGSCALVAMLDVTNSVLRVANTGDSRAVLGRWDPEKGRYVAIPLSKDHTGFNAEEVERLRREHPDENVIDPETGRVFGLAVSRAFGDSRWKVPEAISQFVHERLWGYKPRPNGVVKTPPYLTAEPEVTETRIQTGNKPDFVIMASDGLWEKMSNDNAVLCVDQWLQKYSPIDDLSRTINPVLDFGQLLHPSYPFTRIPMWTADDGPQDEETYYDEKEKATLWTVTPKHFVTEDSNVGMHLIKNALGGSRRSLFLRAMTVQPPMSRAIRDDISVKVLFFGVDDSNLPPQMGNLPGEAVAR